MRHPHHVLCEKVPAYHRWHQHPLHPHVHWGILGAVVLGVALSFVILGWSEVEVANVQVARAQTSEVGTDGKTFERRKADWIARYANESNFNTLNPNPHLGRRYLLAWAEAGTHSSCRGQQEMAAIFDSSESCWTNAEEQCMGVKIDRGDGVEGFEDPVGTFAQYNDLRCIAGNIPALTRWAMESGSFSAATLARLAFQYNVSDTRLSQWIQNIVSDGNFFDGSPNIRTDMQPLKAVVHYLAAMRSPNASVTWANRGPGFSREFTYNGTTYTPSNYNNDGVTRTYNALQFSRDWMYAWMEERVQGAVGESNSRVYEPIAINAIRLLYDFGEPEMKQRAKMFLDFMLLDADLQFSLGVNQWGGMLGRTYRWSFRNGSDWMPWYDYWGANRAAVEPEGLVSSYRVPGVIYSIPNLSGSNWMLKRESYKKNMAFVTPSFIVGSSGYSRGWRITVRGSSGDGIPFDFWLNDYAGDLDNASCGQAGQVVQGRTVSTCGGGECYSCLGSRGYQLRNNILIEGLENPVMHFTNASQSFDVVEGRLDPTGQWEYEYWLNNGRWNYLREGDTAIAIHPGPGTGGVEVARIDSSCTAEHCYSSWGAFTSAPRSVGSGSFTNGKGRIISASTADSGTSLRFVAESSDSPNLVTWSGNTMTVSKGGRTCNYDFGNWTFSGDCGGTSTPPPKTCTTQTCTTTAGCAGTCSADQTYCIDVANDNCPAGVGSCGVPGASCSLDSCLGKCDSSGNTCVKTDPSCGGEGSCPTTCISMGGDTCSDSLKNATELTACSTAYCAPNYAPKSYCVKCNPGSTLNPATDRCEAGSTQNQPPRNLVLRYLGPTPTGGTPATNCGNGTIQTGEQCDGTNLNSQTCQTRGLSGTGLSCNPDCTFNTSQCTSAQQCTPSCGSWSDATNQCGTRMCTRTDCSTYSDIKSCGTTYDPRQGHTYPRLSAFTWGGAVPWYYAQLDLIDTGNSNPAFAQAIKAINPNTRVVVTKDIQAGFSEAPLPQEWRARASKDYNGDGKPDFCVIYGGSQAKGPYYYDITDAAPLSEMPQTNCGAYCGQRYNQYIDDLYRQTVDLSVFDGVATDGLWDRYSGGAPCDSDIDLDRNGQNDYSERGKQGVDSQISAGALKMIQGMRAAAGTNKLIIVNSGGPHTYGMQDSNGFIHEHFIGHFGFDWNKGVYENWMANGVQPVTPIVNTDTVGGSPITPNRNDFPLMRYGLTFALITGSYFDFTDYDRAGEHYWVKYYDEYDTNFGYPLGPAQKTPSGAWVRFFDNGMAITNGSDTDTVTVRVSEVRGMAGYNPGNTGFYHRFRGGQDLAINGTNAMNNGDPFDDTHPIVLKNRQQLGRDAQGELHPTQADGIILLREPQAVVSDIILDNWNSGTSPGSRSPGDYYEDRDAFSGFTQAADPVGDWCGFGSDYYTTRCSIFFKRDSANNYMKDARGEFIPSEVYHSPPFATAPAGSSARADYTPNIGVAGQYRIYEWHGRLNQGTLASNARYVIDAAPVAAASNCTTTGVSATCTVNQQVNSGQWNLLGTYRFTTTGGENVSILASGANGTVMADAVMFRYVGP